MSSAPSPTVRIVVQEKEPVLRARAQEVSPKTIASNEVQALIDDMLATLAAEKMGAALAAPQIGESLRLFVVSPEVLRPRRGEVADPSPLVCINPEIVKRSKEAKMLHEGCLSVRGWWGYIERSDKVTMRALDRHGREFTRGASGLLAQIFQHEIDHLDGLLYIDRASDMHTDAELKQRENTDTVKEARTKTRERTEASADDSDL
jgi:peptide deformylase